MTTSQTKVCGYTKPNCDTVSKGEGIHRNVSFIPLRGYSDMSFIKMIRKTAILFLTFMLYSGVWAEGKIIRLEFGEPDSQSINLPLKKQFKKKKVGLVLSGGGARGFTQIGILKVLEKEQIPIDYIAGTSMGGVVGGLFAAGYSAEELEKLVLKTNWEDILSDSPNRLSLFLSQREESEDYFLKIRFKGFRPYMPTALTSGQKINDLF
ncbi:MAG: patatin-like phospholipase family protein, partial [candidate division Zixibacteria bacterium]|nr:patatin-like phospholipase family protein [candidate division Zixibacteria bacterium]